MTAFAHSRNQEIGPKEVIYPLPDDIKKILGIPLTSGPIKTETSASDEGYN